MVCVLGVPQGRADSEECMTLGGYVVDHAPSFAGPCSGIVLLASLPLYQPSSQFARPVVNKSQVRVTCDI